MAEIILPYDGTNASVPANWSRYTAWDGKYPKASTTDLDGTGGSSTHTHTSPSHTHTYATNAHVHATGTIGPATGVEKTDARHADLGEYSNATTAHTHASLNSGSFISSSITGAVSSIGTASNEYSRYHVIFIKGSVFLPIPSAALIMRNDTDSRASATHFDSMNGRFMKGAGAGANAGSGTDVTTHTHTQSHSHTLKHDHNNVTCGDYSGGLKGSDIPSSTVGHHTHTIYFAEDSENRSNTTAITAGTGTLAYRELHFWKATSQTEFVQGDIALSIEADVPIGWDDLEYGDVYIKGKAEGEALTTGGSNTHTHSSLSHSHAGTSHTHTYTSSSASGSEKYRSGGSTDIIGTHSHSGTTESATSPTTGTSSATLSTNNAEPTYVKAKYIEFQYPPVLPNPILNMLIDRVENN